MINALYIKPIDEKLLIETAKDNKPIFVYTSDILKGGLGDEILECLNKNQINCPLYIFGIDDVFVKHGSIDALKKYLSLDLDSLFNFIKDTLC